MSSNSNEKAFDEWVAATVAKWPEWKRRFNLSIESFDRRIAPSGPAHDPRPTQTEKTRTGQK